MRARIPPFYQAFRGVKSAGMAAACRFLLVCLLGLSAPRLWAAGAAEKAAFEAAANAFNETVWDRAEAEFARFAQTYTNSTRLPEVFLYQAEARLKQANYAGALELLAAHQGQAGKLADSYVFWQGEALLEKGEHAGAIDTFERLLRDFPASTNRLRAAVRRAAAQSKLGQWPRVVENLQQANGPLQTAAAANPADELVIRGYLLLSEAQLAQGAASAAETSLSSIKGQRLAPQLAWEREFLGCRILVAENRTEEALQSSTNLLPLAVAAGKRGLEADASAFQAGLFERVGRTNEAVAAYQRNLAGAFPADAQRQALLKITEIYLRQNRIGEAAQSLERFLSNYPAAESSDLGLVTLGELRLRQFESGLCTNVVSLLFTNPPVSTNCLGQAIALLEGFTNRFPQSPLSGRAHLYLGWCFWRDGKIPASQSSFQAAVERLPVSPELAGAYFKLADAQYRQGSYALALTNYAAVLSRFENQPEVRTNLFEPALYHVVRAALNAGDLPSARNALARVLADYPKGFYTDRAVLLTGQIVGNQDPAAARKIFEDFVKADPEAPRRAELELAIAATYEQENQWDAAIQQYDFWLNNHTNHQGQARTEYARAWANFQAGHDTNALMEFTNFIAHFPTNEFAPRAQWWVSDYFYNQGDFQTAEQNYQWCYQNTNWPPSRLTYEARMMAGRSAFARSSWKDAKDYFGWLAGNTNCPVELRGQAFFALGDTLVSQSSSNKLADYKEALSAFDQVVWLCPSNRIAVLALGEKANCFLQCQEYASATNAFLQVATAPLADVTARSGAKIGLGLALEKLALQPGSTNTSALLALARDQCLDVFDNNNFLREREQADPFWTKEAGLEAVRLCEALKQPGQARRICERLQQQFPSLHLADKLKALGALEHETSARD